MCLSDKASVSGPLDGGKAQEQVNQISISPIGWSVVLISSISTGPSVLPLIGCLFLSKLVNLSMVLQSVKQR